jgi:GNAT superfamily N-acetyltransferase
MTRSTAAAVSIQPFRGRVSRSDDTAALDAIFFGSSNTKTFESDEIRRQFRDRWLGRYLRLDPAEAFLAVDRTGSIVGYLVGCLSDPARESRFEDIGYFHLLADLTTRFPAHLHVNLAPSWRGTGVGSRLVGQFITHAAQKGSRGVHVVTSEGARNVGFYNRNGFTQQRTFTSRGNSLVMLGRSLEPK